MNNLFGNHVTKSIGDTPGSKCIAIQPKRVHALRPQVYSWLVRLVHFGTSWAATADIESISTESTDTKLAAVQLKELNLRHPQAKVIVADSRYEDHHFLGVCLSISSTRSISLACVAFGYSP